MEVAKGGVDSPTVATGSRVTAAAAVVVAVAASDNKEFGVESTNAGSVAGVGEIVWDTAGSEIFGAVMVTGAAVLVDFPGTGSSAIAADSVERTARVP